MRDERQYLDDIVEAAELIDEHVKSASLQEFRENMLLQRAVLFNFTIIGEAANKLEDTGYADGDVRLLETEPELALIRKLLVFPETVESAALTMSPHQLAFYVLDLAGQFSQFYRDCPVKDAEPEALKSFRIGLSLSAKRTLARALDLLGVSAPESM